MDSNRREFLRRMVVSSVFLAVTVTGVYEAVQRLELVQPGLTTSPQSMQSLQTTSTPPISQTSQSIVTGTPPGYFYVGKLSDLGSATAAYFTHPTSGKAILLNSAGNWKAFDATCTHQPCTVRWQNEQIYCPCHDGTFDPANGAVTGGPPPSRLPEFGVRIESGDIYVSNSIIN
jgi:Rieske Fe-S protein